MITDDKIKVYLPENDKWRVELFVPFEEMSNDLTSKLRQAKAKISKRDKIPIGQLTYDNLLDKEAKSNGYKITALITKKEVETGNPVLRFIKASSDDIEYDDMAVYMDIFPKTESGNEVTLKDINAVLNEAKLEKDKIDDKIIDDALLLVKRDMVTARNVLLAQGRFPDPSDDARLDFFIPFKDFGDRSYIGREEVKPKRIILRKIPARKGKKIGFTVRKVKLEPREPNDIELMGGEGVKIVTVNGEVVAEKAGLPRIIEKINKSDNKLTKIVISIEEMDVVDGSVQIDITTENHLQVAGGLKSGSRIISRGEVIVHGDIDDNTNITAKGDVSVTGRINGGSITSEKDIDGEGDINGSRLMAHGSLNLKGTVTNSHLHGMEVNVRKVVGCDIHIGSKTVIDTVSADEKGFTAKITAGMLEHLQDKVKDNQEFIDYALKNLKKFEVVVGEEIVKEATPANVSRMTIMHCKNLKNEGQHSISKEQIDVLKKLLIAIGPIRITMEEKSRAIHLYLNQINTGNAGDPEIYVRDGIEAPVEIELCGTKGKIAPPSKAVVVKKGDGVFEVNTWTGATEDTVEASA